MLNALQDPDLVGSNGVFDTLRSAGFQALHQGLTEDEFVTEVLNSDLRDERRIEVRARKSYSWCEEKFDYGDSIEDKILGMVDWVFSHEWSKGRAGINERAAALAILARCQELGAYSPNVSARWLASQLGMTDQGSADAVRSRLVDHGFMKLVGTTRRFGNQYELNLNRVPSTTNRIYRYSLFVVVQTQLELGPVPAWIHHMLPETTALEASRFLGVSKSTAERALVHLVDQGLAEKIGKTYHRTNVYQPVMDEIPNRFADEQTRNRLAVEEGYKNRQSKELNDTAELLAELQDQAGQTRVEFTEVCVSGDVFNNPVYETRATTMVSRVGYWLMPPALVWTPLDNERTT